MHRCEPYVYAQTIAGRDALTHGEAKNSWLTGTAAWNYFAVTRWILGIRPTHNGLKIAPVIPTHWPCFQAPRRFRRTTYRISVERVALGNDYNAHGRGQAHRGRRRAASVEHEPDSQRGSPCCLARDIWNAKRARRVALNAVPGPGATVAWLTVVSASTQARWVENRGHLRAGQRNPNLSQPTPK